MEAAVRAQVTQADRLAAYASIASEPAEVLPTATERLKYDPSANQNAGSLPTLHHQGEQ